MVRSAIVLHFLALSVLFNQDAKSEQTLKAPSFPTMGCANEFGRLLTKNEIVVGRHVTVRGVDGRMTNARIVSVDPNDGVGVLLRPEEPFGTYRVLSNDETANLRASSDINKVPMTPKARNFVENLLLALSQPITPNIEMTREAFKEWKSIQLQHLIDNGVKLRDIETEDMFTAYSKSIGEDPIRFLSTVRQVTQLPIAGKKVGLDVEALFHPEMSSYLKEIERDGYRLAVDLTLPFTGAGAYLDPATKVLALGHKSTWREFLHEYEHLRIDHFLESRAKFLKKMKSGGAAEVLPPEVINKLGKERLQAINTFEQRGLPENAYHETMAVEAELKALGWRRYVVPTAFISRNYRLNHRITELLQIENRTPDQNRELRLALRNKLANVFAGIPSRHPIITGTAAAYYPVKTILFSEKEDEPYVYVEREDGTWIKMKAEK